MYWARVGQDMLRTIYTLRSLSTLTQAQLLVDEGE